MHITCKRMQCIECETHVKATKLEQASSQVATGRDAMNCLTSIASFNKRFHIQPECFEYGILNALDGASSPPSSSAPHPPTLPHLLRAQQPVADAIDLGHDVRQQHRQPLACKVDRPDAVALQRRHHRRRLAAGGRAMQKVGLDVQRGLVGERAGAAEEEHCPLRQ
eukprot:365907-Chlamydomonas_euryale.AAC.30